MECKPIHESGGEAPHRGHEAKPREAEGFVFFSYLVCTFYSILLWYRITLGLYHSDMQRRCPIVGYRSLQTIILLSGQIMIHLTGKSYRRGDFIMKNSTPDTIYMLQSNRPEPPDK